MISYYAEDLPGLIGKTLVSVTQYKQDLIEWQMYYEQDCCASCHIEDVVGDLNDLVGTPIVMAEAVTNNTDPQPPADYPDESYTWTFYKLATAKGYVTIRWYGSSNGYYSETASFKEIVQ